MMTPAANIDANGLIQKEGPSGLRSQFDQAHAIAAGNVPSGRKPVVGEIQTSARGIPFATTANAIAAISTAPWVKVIGYNEFSKQTEVRGKNFLVDGPYPRAWSDVDDTRVTDWLNKQQINVRTNVSAEAIEVVARHRTFHPVKDYLRALPKHDGVPRLRTFASRYLGRPDDQYTSEVMFRFSIQAVARIIEPGCKADCMLILEGDQGVGKSNGIRTLFGEGWFTDDIADFGSKDAAMQLSGVWAIEVPELDNFSRNAVETVKAFISRREDRFRPAYGRRVVTTPRQCVFIGTTNQSQYLRDETGGRRFWPVRVVRIDVAAIERDRDQIWAEALALYRSKERWWLSDEASKLASAEQEARFVGDVWEDRIASIIEGRKRIAIPDLLELLGIPGSQQEPRVQHRCARILLRLKWERRQVREGKRKRWVYERTGGAGDATTFTGEATTYAGVATTFDGGI